MKIAYYVVFFFFAGRRKYFCCLTKGANFPNSSNVVQQRDYDNDTQGTQEIVTFILMIPIPHGNDCCMALMVVMEIYI